MSSAVSDAGSTTRWRRTRAVVLDRDRRRCQVPMPDGGVCGEYADTAGHIVPRVQGGTDALTNLRAECRAHNFSAGAALSNRARPPPRAPSRW
jgi:5-methylcytosine-specific restriction endonuclease McrA